MKKVFLGGTCNESKWREELIELLKINYFNPVVSDWTEECMEEEIKQREICDYCLYVITPRMTGVYSIAEVIDDSNKRPEKTIFCVLKSDKNTSQSFASPLFTTDMWFSQSQIKSLEQVGKMVRKNGGKYFRTLEDVAEYLNVE
jgi:hypothetical protein